MTLINTLAQVGAKLAVHHATSNTSTTSDDVSGLDLAEIITWSRATDSADHVHQQYVQLLLGDLERVVDQLRLADNAACGRLLDAIATLDDAALIRVLTAPEVSYSLLCPPDRSMLEIAGFISRAALAEAGRTGAPVHVGAALGIMCLIPGDAPFAEGEVQHLYRSLAAALAGIRKTHARLFEFVGRFNKVLIWQKDPAAPTLFSSGSTAHYIGRSFLTNPHIHEVDEADLAEALIRQGIHGLLSMDDRRRPWMTTPATDATWPALGSPWGGQLGASRLSIRAYVQACFVWFGLAHFWAQALSTSSFPAAHARRSLARCVSGFSKGSLLDRLGPYSEGVRPDLCVAIEAMQSKICAVLANQSTQTEPPR